MARNIFAAENANLRTGQRRYVYRDSCRCGNLMAVGATQCGTCDAEWRRSDVIDNFYRHVQPNVNGCWIWTPIISPSGYGKWAGKVDGKRHYGLAHRFVWESIRGPIPNSLQLDHLCRVRACVNPRHLEAVTPRTNNLRSNSPSATFARRTHCNAGHEYNEENTRFRASGRRCRICDALTHDEKRRKLGIRSHKKRRAEYYTVEVVK